ncbi:MAG: glutathione S-transferase family protein [Gammaproteobacteria bacterium]|nr:glutathione S-transferase family protein [Gammaproteobacteria bacterium]
MTYKVFGIEESPYSVKVRSYFRYKEIPHDWVLRNEDSETYTQHARLPLIPLVVKPDGDAIQDSTPIIEAMEAAFPVPSIHPPETVTAFASCLLEEFGDEWGNKWMFHFRWRREIDQLACGRRLAEWSNPFASDDELSAITKQIQTRMVDRVWFVGSSDQTAEQIEQSLADALDQLETHLNSRPYVFGARPSFGDFGMWGQIYNANRDPTPAKLVRAHPNVHAWTRRMLSPINEGEFESWDAVKDTLIPLIRDQIGSLFLPWSVANSKAIADSSETFQVELAGKTWAQRPQKYHARSQRFERNSLLCRTIQL